MTELADLGVLQALDALKNGECSSVELTRAVIKRIDQLEPSLHTFITRTSEQALAQAKAADDLRFPKKKSTTAKSPLPPLLGLPIAVKDVLCLKGVRCTSGSKILENFVAPYTATAVQRLLDAGVVVLGKTNTDEFAMGSSTENSAYDATHNPWDVERVPGGSSGGSAAAVAARMTPAAFGTDTGGSVRQPASFCGVTGIKPTYGRVSRYGLIAYGSSLDTVGMLARTAEDVAILFSHFAGFDPRDATTLEVPIPEIKLTGDTQLKGLKVGVPKQYFIRGIQPEVEKAVKIAIEQLENLGAEHIPISLPHTDFALPVYYIIAPAEASANLARFDGIRFGPAMSKDDLRELYFATRGKLFGSEVKRRIMLGTYALSTGYYDAYYNQAQKVRTLIKRDFDEAFKKVDVIAAPVAPTTAFKIGEHTEDPLAMYLEDIFTLPANLAGVPAIAFPVGLDSRGMPIGMQLMGRYFDEPTLFKAAHAYQKATEWHLRRPTL
jgi:aspartyl-tRNA(Asn)/glutamyl-tRNA(Gln) amidotransferase subunit A